MASQPPVLPATSSQSLSLFERQLKAQRRDKRLSTLVSLGLFLIVLAWSIEVSGFAPSVLLAGLPRFGEYIHLTLPTLSLENLLANTDTKGSIPYWFFNFRHYVVLLFQTINMAILATLVSFVLGAALSFPASRNLAPNRLTYLLARRGLEIARSVPDLVWALLFVWAFGIGPLAGIVAIIVHSTGALGKLFSEINENIPMSPLEGIRATGASWFQEMRYAVLPQVMPLFLSNVLWRFESNIRQSSVIGFVGGGGIGEELYLVIVRNYYEEVSALVLLIVLTVTCIDLLSAHVRHGLIGKERLA
ncbi:phosphonate transport system permease protein [Arboricoccus pini]|uniref:Phosphonate transport system permease protein n=1 Tax=Arboricoccus pini TaxID=1963835 RepID=A0A212RZK5_9PROT|nr:phosphonate ABC transporter, permease protein PhnE [Arboricoccus pini]SNB78213.1 phosphonate transport system permease protein [Arboricoccus pini]